MVAGAGDDTVKLGDTNDKMDGILGAVELVGENGTDQLVFEDRGANANHTYKVTNAAVTSRDGGLVTLYEGFEGLELNGANGGPTGNTVYVYSVAANTSTRINAGAKNDTVHVASSNPDPRRLDEILALLTLDGQAGTNEFIIDDGGNPVPHRYRVTDDGVTRIGGPTIRTLNYFRRVVTGGRGGAWVQVDANPTGTVLVAQGSEDNDVFTLGEDTLTVDAIRGSVVFFSGSGSDELRIFEQNYFGGETYYVSPTSVQVSRLNDLTVSLTGIPSVALYSGEGDDEVILEALPSDFQFVYHAALGYDSVRLISGTANGPVLDSVEYLHVLDGIFALNGSGMIGSPLPLSDYVQNGTIYFDLLAQGILDQLIVSGTVTLAGDLVLSTPPGFIGDFFTLIDNVGTSLIDGIFTNLAEGTLLFLDGRTFAISYVGGDGNDVVLTWVP